MGLLLFLTGKSVWVYVDKEFNSFWDDQSNFDATRHAFFRGYGKETRIKPHPCLNEQWDTTFRKTYLKPGNRTKPNARLNFTVNEQEFDQTMSTNQRPAHKKLIASGFQNNA